MRQNTALTFAEVKSLSTKIGSHSVGGIASGSLLLIVEAAKEPGKLKRRWQWMTRTGGKKRTVGLGSYAASSSVPGLTLSQAREAANETARQPQRPQPKERRTASANQTCSELILEWIEFKKARKAWDNPRKESGVISARFEKYAAPYIGNLSAKEVTPREIGQVMTALQDAGMASTAKKIKSFLRDFFNWCILVKECRPMETGNPVNTEFLKILTPPKKTPDRPQPSCKIEDLPRFFRAVVSSGAINTPPGIACLFAILTCSRYSNIGQSRGIENHCAVWEDIDIQNRLWKIPAAKMKAKLNGDHWIPLSDQCLSLLKRLEVLGMKHPGAVFVYLNGRAFSEGAIRKLIERRSAEDIETGGNGFMSEQVKKDGSHRLMTLHGTARGTFRSWCTRTGEDIELAEIALHHRPGKITAAYQHDKAIERRRELMQRWADFCFSELPKDWAKV
ncbi:MAG: hypothetical protein IJ164_00360 [Duodenibacillus sp.]|nr:hypothetical protein [Duodenibacillus sp.]